MWPIFEAILMHSGLTRRFLIDLQDSVANWQKSVTMRQANVRNFLISVLLYVNWHLNALRIMIVNNSCERHTTHTQTDTHTQTVL